MSRILLAVCVALMANSRSAVALGPTLNEWLIRGQAGENGDCMSEWRLAWGCEVDGQTGKCKNPPTNPTYYMPAPAPPATDGDDVQTKQVCFDGDPNCDMPVTTDGQGNPVYKDGVCRFRLSLCFCVEHPGIPCEGARRDLWCNGTGTGGAGDYGIKYYFKVPNLKVKGTCTAGSVRHCLNPPFSGPVCDQGATCADDYRVTALQALRDGLTQSRDETGTVMPPVAFSASYDLNDCDGTTNDPKKDDFLMLDLYDTNDPANQQPRPYPYCRKTPTITRTNITRSSEPALGGAYRCRYPMFGCVRGTSLPQAGSCSASTCPASTTDEFNATSSNPVFYFGDRNGCGELQEIDVPLGTSRRVAFSPRTHFWPNGEHNKVNSTPNPLAEVDRNSETLSLVCCNPDTTTAATCR